MTEFYVYVVVLEVFDRLSELGLTFLSVSHLPDKTSVLVICFQGPIFPGVLFSI